MSLTLYCTGLKNSITFIFLSRIALFELNVIELLTNFTFPINKNSEFKQNSFYNENNKGRSYRNKTENDPWI